MSGNEQTGRFHVPKRAPGPSTWIALAAVGITVLLSARVWFIDDGQLQAQVQQNTRDIADNGTAISSTPALFVPRGELDAKMDNLQLQVKNLKEDVGELKAQTTRQTNQIIQSIQQAARQP